MQLKDFLRALLVVVIWGLNFIAIKFGVGHIPPSLLVGLRFIFAAFPAIFFVKRPAVSWKYMFAYAMTVGVGQFTSLFYGMKIGMPAGVASVVVQSQAFFTILMERALYKDKLMRHQLIGLIVAAVGLVLVSGNLGGAAVPIPLPALLLTLLAAIFWAMSNIVVSMISQDAKSRDEAVDIFSVVVWSSLIPPIPMFAMALLFHGSEECLVALGTIDFTSIIAIMYLGWCSTLIGYGIWSSLMAKYPPKNVAPLSLLVPVIGLLGARVVLGESLSMIQWIGCGIIILGLLIFNRILKRGEAPEPLDP